jgi:5-methylcytosine-specific restriction protein A
MNYNESDWPEVRLLFESAGKAPKKYGEDVLRFSAALTLSVILPRRGWMLIKRAKNYAYLKPPAGISGKTFQIDIKIPSRLQAIEIAEQCYTAGESWIGQIGEWPVWYIHARSQDMHEIMPNIDGGKGYTTRLVDGGPPSSTLVMGEYGIWSVTLRTTNGDFSFLETGNYEPSSKPLKSKLIEGKASELLLTEYERSNAAREACVQLHGFACAACGFDFESVYGEIGTGFIHIHHARPIAGRGGAYQIDPVNDLIPLCPNCHAMAHRREPPVSVAELRMLLANNAKRI